MPAVKSHGLILRRTPFSETSLILKAFTRYSGLITLMAKGAKRQKSKFHGLLDAFTVVQLVYPEKSKTEIHTLTDVGLVRDFPRLKSEPARQALANVFLEVYLKYMHEPHPSPPHYHLLLESLERLDEADSKGFDPVLHACDFLLSLCSISGFSPQFSRCVQCGSEAVGLRLRLDPESGGPVCLDCSGPIGGGELSFSRRLLIWLDRVQTMGLRAGRIPRKEEIQAENFLLGFLGKHAGGERPVKSMAFYRQMTDGT